jgi:hypothetical protein
MQWLYIQELDVLEAKEDFTNKNLDRDMNLAKLWVLADKLCIPQLQNALIDCIEDICARTKDLALETLHYVWDNTPNDSPLRKYFIWSCAFNLQPPEFSRSIGMFPKGMLGCIAWYLAQIRKDRAEGAKDPEEYSEIAYTFYVSID